MLSEAVQVVAVRRKLDFSSKKELHIGTESQPVICSRSLEGMDVRSAYTNNDEADICEECQTTAMAASVDIANLAKSVDQIVTALKADAGSLDHFGDVPRAIGQLSKASTALWDVAKHRALEERMGEGQNGGASS